MDESGYKAMIRYKIKAESIASGHKLKNTQQLVVRGIDIISHYFSIPLPLSLLIGSKNNKKVTKKQKNNNKTTKKQKKQQKQQTTKKQKNKKTIHT